MSQMLETSQRDTTPTTTPTDTSTRTIPKVSFADSLLYNVASVLPYLTAGIFTRNRFWVGFWARVHPDPMGVRLISYLRRKYQSEYLYVGRSLVVLDLEGIRRVLDHSPDIYADAALKRKGMSHFQPGAVTISRGDEWYDRRRFNEAVLDTPQPVHHDAAGFLDIVRREVNTMRQGLGPQLTWNDFDALFQKITLQVIFGARAREDATVLERLKHMMREANRVFLLWKSKHFDAFYDQVRGYLAAPERGSLAFECGRAPSTETTRVENQVPHWMFAMAETLATNTARALALIAAHPAVDDRVRDELAAADLSSPQGIRGLTYLEGCIQEAMRLWPTTPMLAREMVAADTLGGAVVPPVTQVLILNNFNHRDRERFPLADTFGPEQWVDGRARADYRFNHVSNGTQVCAGVHLLVFIAQAVLATLLSQDRFVLARPKLDPSRPLPYAFDYFELALSRYPLA